MGPFKGVPPLSRSTTGVSKRTKTRSMRMRMRQNSVITSFPGSIDPRKSQRRSMKKETLKRATFKVNQKFNCFFVLWRKRFSFIEQQRLNFVINLLHLSYLRFTVFILLKTIYSSDFNIHQGYNTNTSVSFLTGNAVLRNI